MVKGEAEGMWGQRLALAKLIHLSLVCCRDLAGDAAGQREHSRIRTHLVGRAGAAFCPLHRPTCR
jgi:hypothetical protein